MPPVTRQRFLAIRALKTLIKKIPTDIVDKDKAIVDLINMLLARNVYEGETGDTLRALVAEFNATGKLPHKKVNEDFP